MKFQTLTPEEVAIILPRITDEQNARYLYEAGFAWARLNGYNKVAKWCKKQAKEEACHYNWLVKMLVDWNVKVELPTIQAPKSDFENLTDFLEQIYTMEYTVGENYNNDAIALFPLNQMLYRKFLVTFVHIQKNEVEDRKRKLDAAYKWIISDPNLMEFEENNF
jgi:ferritin